MFCNKFGNKIRDVYKKFDNAVKESVETSIAITANLKQLLNGNIVNVLTMVIPGTWDDEVINKAKQALEFAVDKLQLTNKCLEKPTLAEKIACFAFELKGQSPLMQQAVLHKLASLMASQLDGNRFSRSDYDSYVQGIYSANK